MGGNVKRKKNVRYFSRAELKQLFTLYPAGACRVCACRKANEGCTLPPWCWILRLLCAVGGVDCAYIWRVLGMWYYREQRMFVGTASTVLWRRKPM